MVLGNQPRAFGCFRSWHEQWTEYCRRQSWMGQADGQHSHWAKVNLCLLHTQREISALNALRRWGRVQDWLGWQAINSRRGQKRPLRSLHAARWRGFARLWDRLQQILHVRSPLANFQVWQLIKLDTPLHRNSRPNRKPVEQRHFCPKWAKGQHHRQN